MIMRLFTPSTPLEPSARAKLVIIVDVLIAVVVLLLFFGLAFQIYAFQVYRADVRSNRILLCSSAALRGEEFCRDVPKSKQAVEKAIENRAKERIN